VLAAGSTEPPVAANVVSPQAQAVVSPKMTVDVAGETRQLGFPLGSRVISGEHLHKHDASHRLIQKRTLFPLSKIHIDLYLLGRPHFLTIAGNSCVAAFLLQKQKAKY
jgi:hypothetical protein